MDIILYGSLHGAAKRYRLNSMTRRRSSIFVAPLITTSWN